MQLIEWNEFIISGLPLENSKSAAVTVGVFDGVHKGHKALIKRVVECGKDTVPVVFTFKEPAHKSERAEFIIHSFQEKTAALETLGIKFLVVIDFTEEFSSMTGLKFLETLSSRVKIGYFAVGANFRCGCRLDTDAETIRKFFAEKKIPAEIVPEVLHDDIPISSSRIREALAAGDLELAESML